MNAPTESVLRRQLLERRTRLEDAIAGVGEAAGLVRLLREVDAALKRMDGALYGRCEVCREDVQEELLQIHPLIQYCLCNLTPEQQRALEQDLGLASRLQWALLPTQNLSFAGWATHFRYEPAGPVSGDYCDLVAREGQDRCLYFVIGDVSGKGVASSFVMAHLSAMFRSLIDTDLPVDRLVERANAMLVENRISSHYATLVCGRAGESGEVELCNAGHCPPLVVGGAEVTPVEAAGLPVGLLGGDSYTLRRARLHPGDTLFLYTDGLVEAGSERGEEYGMDRLRRVLAERHALTPGGLAAACLEDVSAFLAGTPRGDDLTLLVIRRTG
jgi:sigma-B regulation protein RsbU (phosphoserine phosphatase)